MPIVISRSQEQTIGLGEQWGREAQAGWVLALTGDLGAGKTQLVKGIARGLGIASSVRSPSFTLVHEHSGGRLPLYHLDLYRLETPAQIIAAGLENYLFQQTGVTVIEWAERWFGADPGAAAEISRRNHLRRVFIEPLNETERRIQYEDSGP